MDSVKYRIADQAILVKHPDGNNLITQALSKYEPFRVESTTKDEEICLEVEAVKLLSIHSSARAIESARNFAYEAQIYLEEEQDTYYIVIGAGANKVEGRISKDWQHLQICADWSKPRYAPLIDRMIMIVFSMAIQSLGYLKVHASVVELHGQALVFMGVSGTGKSTHSRLWLQYVPGSSLLNDDEPFVRLCPDGVVRVYGCPWSGSTDCYRAISAEVVAFVHLYQAPENKLQKLKSRDALISLFSSSAFLLNEESSRLQVFDSVSAVLSKVSVYRLDNRPEQDAVRLTYSLLNLNTSLI